MRVYAVCRKCAEVHLSDAGCPRCARRALLAQPSGVSTLALATAAEFTREGSVAAPASPGDAVQASPAASTPPARLVRLSTAVIGAYLLLVFALLAAVLLDT